MAKVQIYLFLTLTAIILLSWGSIFHQHWLMQHRPMSEMWMPPADIAAWTVFDFCSVFVMWAIMMLAMMLPSATPTLLAFSRICQQRKQSAYTLSLIFILGYLLAWFLFSIVLTIVQWQMHGLLWLSPMMENNNPLLSIIILLSAGLYQFFPLKNACLKYCQSPVGFLLNHWQSRARGAFNMGARHGLTCLGCCWAEMLIMFAVGVMNIAGMIIITLLIVLEKFSPIGPRTTSLASALLFFSWAVYLINS
ncbi:MAG: DUF2182 domain-containing protein [Gammaproteobacteria bacterium]